MSIALYDRNENALAFQLMTFSGGERHVQLDPNFSGSQFIVQANLRNATDIIDLLLVANALNARTDVPELFIEIPYLPYARQDRICAAGQAFSLQVMSGFLSQIQNVKELVVWDCHSPVGLKLTGAKNIAPQQIIKASQTLTDMLIDPASVIICPDKGAIERTQNIAKALGDGSPSIPIVFCEKVRDPATGNITHTAVKADSLAGKTAIITDDICDGGYTFIKIAEQLKAMGAQKVILFVTHGIFSKGLTVFDGLIDHVFTTQSFEHAPDPRLTVINYSHHFTAL
jgi:ribose-phosphate pyrophosphokinase